MPPKHSIRGLAFANPHPDPVEPYEAQRGATDPPPNNEALDLSSASLNAAGDGNAAETHSAASTLHAPAAGGFRSFRNPDLESAAGRMSCDEIVDQRFQSLESKLDQLSALVMGLVSRLGISAPETSTAPPLLPSPPDEISPIVSPTHAPAAVSQDVRAQQQPSARVKPIQLPSLVTQSARQENSSIGQFPRDNFFASGTSQQQSTVVSSAPLKDALQVLKAEFNMLDDKDHLHSVAIIPLGEKLDADKFLNFKSNVQITLSDHRHRHIWDVSASVAWDRCGGRKATAPYGSEDLIRKVFESQFLSACRGLCAYLLRCVPPHVQKDIQAIMHKDWQQYDVVQQCNLLCEQSQSVRANLQDDEIVDCAGILKMLSGRYNLHDWSRVQKLQRRISRATLKELDHPQVIFTKLDAIFTDLQNVVPAYQRQPECLVCFTIITEKLPDFYQSAVNELLTRYPVEKLAREKVLIRLGVEFQHHIRKIEKLERISASSKKIPDTAAANSSVVQQQPQQRCTHSASRGISCFNCLEEGHLARNCPHPDRRTRSNSRVVRAAAAVAAEEGSSDLEDAAASDTSSSRDSSDCDTATSN